MPTIAPKALSLDLDDTLWPIWPVIEQAEHALDDRMEQIVESLHDHRAVRARRLTDLLGFGGVARERLSVSTALPASMAARFQGA